MMFSPSPLFLPTVESLRAFLQARFPLPANEQQAEIPTLWREPPDAATDAPVEHLTLALDFRALADAGDAGNEPNIGRAANAVFLHRPFDLPTDFWPGVPVFASHRGLDAHLSVGWNPALAQTLLLQNTTELFREPADTHAHPIGMVGDLPEPVPFGNLFRHLSVHFGGMETVLINGRETVERLAIMGAMTPALVRQASEAGAQGYLTGQVRDAARTEAARCSIAVYATGHTRAEWWGLHQLTRELQAAFSGLQTLVVQ